MADDNKKNLVPNPGSGDLYKDADEMPASVRGDLEGTTHTRETLGKYLSDQTSASSAKGTRYPITETGAGEVSDYQRDISSGETPALTETMLRIGPGIQETFINSVLSNVGDDGGIQEHHFSRIGKLELNGLNDINAANLDYDPKKSRAGHDILATTKSSNSTRFSRGNSTKSLPMSDADNEHVIISRTSQVLKTNRFHPGEGSPYVNGGNWNSSLGPQGSLGSYQDAYGKYIGTTGSNFGVDSVKNVGIRLMYAAAADLNGGGGKIGTANAGDALTANMWQQMGLTYIGSHAQTPDLRPGQHVDGSRISNTNTFQPYTEILTSPDNAGKKGWYGVDENAQNIDLDSLLNPAGIRTYGHLNHPGEPFEGVLPLGMLTVTAANLVAMAVAGLAVGVVASLLTFLTNFGTDDEDYALPHTLAKGQYTKPSSETAEFFRKHMGIPKLKTLERARGGKQFLVFPLLIAKGLLSFYGMHVKGDGPDEIIEGILSSIQNLISSAGYYAVMSRNVLRDFEDVIKATEKVNKAGGVGEGIQAALAMLNAMFTTKTYTFFMTMAQLGDLSFYIDSSSGSINGPRDRHGTSRDHNLRDSSLMMRHASLPGSVLLPDAFARATHQLGLSSKGYGDVAYLNAQYKNGSLRNVTFKHNNKSIHKESSPGKGRISNEDVEWIEDQLDTEYMPFYFHDLRTNEIVSFHAFLQSLSDDYSPEYTDVDGFGRLDKVKIYKTTTRNISLSFIVASTSPRDFDIMWVSINKLLTMIYPQWSKGTNIKGQKSAFTMPGSQIMTSTPLIRLRLGDMLKSNYSKFNLARMFGVSEPVAQNLAGTTGPHDVFLDLENAPAGLTGAKLHAVPEGRLPHEYLSSNADVLVKYQDAIRRIKSPVVNFKLEGAVFGFGGTYVGLDKDGNEAGPKEGEIWSVDTRGKKMITPVNVDYEFKTSQLPHPSAKIIAIEPRNLQGALGLVSTGEELLYARVEFLHPLALGQLKQRLKSESGSRPHETVGDDPDAADRARRDKIDDIKNEFWVPVKWLYADARQTRIIIGGGGASGLAEKINDTQASTPSLDFFNSSVNPIVKSFESAGGRGLAGHITQLSFDYFDSPWEIEPGKRGPQWLKVNLSFTPIHDIAPGIDAYGMNRAPVYNVGSILNNASAGDSYGTDYNDPEDRVNQLRSSASDDPFSDEGVSTRLGRKN